MEAVYQKTRDAFLFTRVLSIPLWILISALSFILCKDLHISISEVCLIIALKPISALFAPYWSLPVYFRSDRLVSNLVWGNILRYLPFLFCPLMTSSWQVILAFFFYMVLSRGCNPAWMEIIKCHVPEEKRAKVFQLGSAIEYVGIAFIPVPLLLGVLMDQYHLSWKLILSFSALLGMFSTIFIWRIPSIKPLKTSLKKSSLWDQLIKPWKYSWRVIKERPDFSLYLTGFMIGGSGLMILQPMLPKFFEETLALSYTQMLMATSVCKGIGYAISSPFWVKAFRKMDIFSFSGFVVFLATIFPLILFFSQVHLGWLYAAFILYGIMQSGSELSWHMSGPAFAGENDSVMYTSTNVLAVGLRGCFIPFLGGLLYTYSSPLIVMLVGMMCCFTAGVYLCRLQNVQGGEESSF